MSTSYHLPRLFPLRTDPNGDVQQPVNPRPSEMSPIDGRDRERDRDDYLDGTGSFRRRYEDTHPPSRRVEVPLSLIITIAIYLIGQLVGGIWWAATLQSKVEHEALDRAREEQKLWQKVETHDLQLAQFEKIVRATVKEALVDSGIINRQQKED